MKQHSHTCQCKAFFVQQLDASVPTLQLRDWEARLAFEVIFHVFLFLDFNAYKCQFWYCQGELKLCIPCRCPTILHNLCFLHDTVSWNSCNPHLQPNISTLGVLWFFYFSLWWYLWWANKFHLLLKRFDCRTIISVKLHLQLKRFFTSPHVSILTQLESPLLTCTNGWRNLGQVKYPDVKVWQWVVFAGSLLPPKAC